jgi:hypothetical protein
MVESVEKLHIELNRLFDDAVGNNFQTEARGSFIIVDPVDRLELSDFSRAEFKLDRIVSLLLEAAYIHKDSGQLMQVLLLREKATKIHPGGIQLEIKAKFTGSGIRVSHTYTHEAFIRSMCTPLNNSLDSRNIPATFERLRPEWHIENALGLTALARKVIGLGI